MRARLLLLAGLLVLLPPVLFHRHLDMPLSSDARFLTYQNAYMDDASGLGKVWTADFFEGARTGMVPYYSGYYRPVTNSFNWFVRRLGGADPFAYNLTQTLLHGVVSALALAVLLRIGADPLAAAAGAVLFAVHPVHAFAATEPAAVADVLFPVFFLAGMLAFDRALGVEARARRGAWVAVATALYAGSLLSKEMGATLPAVLVLLVFYRATRGEARVRDAVWTLPAWGVLAGYMVWRFAVLSLPVHDLEYVETHGLVPVAAAQLKSVLIHVARLAVPLGPTYPELDPWLVNVVRDPLTDPLLWPALAVCAGLVAAALLWRRRPRVAFWAAFFLVTLSPLLSVESIAGSLSGSAIATQERWIYLPSIGLLALAGHGIAWLWRRLERPMWRRVAAVAGMAGVLALAWSSTLHAHRDRDPYAELRRLYLFHEDELSRLQLANRYLLYAHWVALPQGDLAEAEARAREAWRLVPDSPRTAQSLALVLSRQGRWAEADRVLRPWYRPEPAMLDRAGATNPRVYDDINRVGGQVAVLMGRILARTATPQAAARAACAGLPRGASPAEVAATLDEIRAASAGPVPGCDALEAR